MKILDLAKSREDYIINMRRHFHKHPELGEKEVETTKVIVAELEKLGIEVETFEGITGCVGLIKGGHPGKTLMLRADIDALPIQETSDKEYKSTNPGVMHACGHDAHTAILLGAAKILNEMKDEIHGNIKLIFQMGEELGRKAEEYVNRGILEGVDAVFGMHVWALLDSGKVNYQKGERMACSDRFTVKISGKAAHGSAPHQGCDAILAAANVVMGLQSIVSRRINPLDSSVITVGKMDGGAKLNIIADEVTLIGTVRAFKKELRSSIPTMMEETITGIAKSYGCEASLDYYFGPAAVINEDENLVNLAREASIEIMGEEALTFQEKQMGAEDFSVYMEHIPGVYGYLGVRNEAKGINNPHHHPLFDIDEAELYKGVGIYTSFAIKYLSQK